MAGSAGTYARGMDRDENTAYLEWWANQSTCLARIPVTLTAASTKGEWEAVLSSPPDDDALNHLQELIEASPYFTLRLGASAVEVQVQPFGDTDHLELAAVVVA
ncbi:hypothetical protein GA0115259_103415 [Streptomyces sp. MnatMP-M17]|nr:hypothetical protein GA0115259_103415 [Streptomyces sp. MnatMP-M17]